MKLFKQIIIVLLLLSLNTAIAHGQSIYAEVPAGDGGMDHALAIPFNDSIFFSYGDNRLRKSKWISQGGKSREVPITEDVISIANAGGKTYYYYLAERKGSVALKARTVSRAGTLETDTASIVLPGSVMLAIYHEKNMFMVLYNRDENQISWLEIDGLKTVRQRKYGLPFDLSFYLREAGDAEFFKGSSAIHTFKGASKIKLFLYDNLYLVFDKPYKSIHQPGRTSVVMFPLNSDQTAYYEFPTKATANFTSFLMDGKLFRSFITKNKFVIRIYDLLSGKHIKEETIDRELESFNVYFRHGKKNQIDKTETLEHMMKVSGQCEPSLTILKDSGQYLVSWGTFFNEHATTGPTYLAPVGLLVSMAYNAVLMSGERPGVNRYFYYSCDPNDLSFKPLTAYAGHTRARLDRYEMEAQVQKVKIGFKDYIAYGGGVMAIYYEPRRKTVQLVSFE